MKSTAPLLTLLAGLGVGAVLFVADTIVSQPDKPPPKPGTAVQAAATRAPRPTAPTTPSTTAPPAAVKKVTATWAGKVDGGKASIAIAAKEGVAVAYVCDGNRVEGWLRGTAADGELSLSGEDGDRLTGTFGNGRAEGSVSVGRWTWTFDVKTVTKPSGLYRATATVRNAEVVGGWIVIDGRQVGSVDGPDGARSAPELSISTLTATWDGAPLVAEPLS